MDIVDRLKNYELSRDYTELASEEAPQLIQQLRKQVAELEADYKKQSELVTSQGIRLMNQEDELSELSLQVQVLRESLYDAIGYIPAYTVNDSVVSKWREALNTTLNPDSVLEATIIMDENVGYQVLFNANEKNCKIIMTSDVFPDNKKRTSILSQAAMLDKRCARIIEEEK